METKALKSTLARGMIVVGLFCCTQSHAGHNAKFQIMRNFLGNVGSYVRNASGSSKVAMVAVGLVGAQHFFAQYYSKNVKSSLFYKTFVTAHDFSGPRFALGEIEKMDAQNKKLSLQLSALLGCTKNIHGVLRSSWNNQGINLFCDHEQCKFLESGNELCTDICCKRQKCLEKKWNSACKKNECIERNKKNHQSNKMASIAGLMGSIYREKFDSKFKDLPGEKVSQVKDSWASSKLMGVIGYLNPECSQAKKEEIECNNNDLVFPSKRIVHVAKALHGIMSKSMMYQNKYKFTPQELTQEGEDLDAQLRDAISCVNAVAEARKIKSGK